MTSGEQEQLRSEIRDTREELGETVAALADKADVSARAREGKEKLKGEAMAKVDQARHVAQRSPNTSLVAVGALIGLLVLLGIVRSKRKSTKKKSRRNR